MNIATMQWLTIISPYLNGGFCDRFKFKLNVVVVQNCLTILKKSN